MRTAFIKTLCELAEQDERIWLLTGDLGYSALESFVERFPERFINMGVAEQNMTGVAAGLSLSGKIVFTYSIANFPTIRCLEQIRNDVCYHNLNVKIVAVGAGFSYGSAGYSHHAVEDLGIMRSLTNMTVVSPGDLVEARLATKAIVNRIGPCYLRLGNPGIIVHQSNPDFIIGKAIVLRDGNDVTLVSTGGLLNTVIAVADKLKNKGISTYVLSMPTIKPIDKNAIVTATKKNKVVFTIEEHNITGGLGSAVAEVLAEADLNKVKFRRLGIKDTFCHDVGSQEYLRKKTLLDSYNLLRQIEDWLVFWSEGKTNNLSA